MKVRTAALIVALALALLAAPLPAEAQKRGKVYRLGFLVATASSGYSWRAARWLPEFGYVEGQNIVFERRFAGGQDKRLPQLAAELVALEVDIILTDGTPAVRAAKEATTRIPIVMVVDGDPVTAGLVASLARPGGNVTGMTALMPELSGKRLELLKEAVPGLTRVGVLWNPSDPDKAAEWRHAQVASRMLEVELESLEVRSRDELESAFEAAIRAQTDGLLVLSDRLTLSHAKRLADLATKSRLPTMYPNRYFVDLYWGGGLMSYGPSEVDLSRRVAAYVGRILKGAKPADLPVEQPTRFELVINLKTANTLGLTIPPSLLFRADKVIK